MIIRFTVPGPVQPWRRARSHRLATGATIHFKDKETDAYQNLWKMAARDAFGDRPLIEGAVSLLITARFVPPASTSKKRREAMLAGRMWPRARIDADNIAKTADALNGLVWRDDVQVARLVVEKVFAETAGVDVSITEL